MKRRFCLFALAGGASGLAALSAAAQPSYRVSSQQLRQVLAQRFPLRYLAAGLFELRIETPALRFLPEQNRLASDLVVEATGPALRRSHRGVVELDFSLRYEPSDLTIRAHRIRVHAVRLPSLTPEAASIIDGYARASAQQALLEVVLHTLRPQDLALAHTMGFEPDSITVEADGLRIGFVAQSR